MAKGYVKSAKEIAIEKKVSIGMIFSNFIVPEIPDYYSVYPVDFETKPVACCPLHDEDTPSFRYYEETNSFYCFGCGKGGNPILLYQLFVNRHRDANITYKESTEFLYKYFIEGKDTAVLPGVAYTDSKKQATDMKAVVRFNRYTDEVEKIITFDKKVPLRIKLKFWKELDTIKLLVGKEQIEPEEARVYMINKVRELSVQACRN